MRRAIVVKVSEKAARRWSTSVPALARSRRSSTSTSVATRAFTKAKANPSDSVASSVQARKMRLVSEAKSRTTLPRLSPKTGRKPLGPGYTSGLLQLRVRGD